MLKEESTGKNVGAVGKSVWTHLVFTFFFSLIFYVIIIRAGTLKAAGLLQILGLMWCPGTAALVTTWIFQRNFKGLGWSTGKVRYLLLGFILPLAYITTAYCIVWLTGLGTFTLDRLPPGKSLIPYLTTTVTAGFFMNLVFTSGEEIGWRGMLVNRLAKLTTFSRTALLSGAVWAVWHYPLTLWGGYNSGTPAWYGLGCFTIMAMAISFPLAWLRLKSGSVWAAVAFHSSHNLFVQMVFNPLTRDTGITRYITGEFGAALALAGVVMGLIFWRLQPAVGKE